MPERYSPSPETLARPSHRINLVKIEALNNFVNPISKFEQRLAKATPDQISLLVAVNNL